MLFKSVDVAKLGREFRAAEPFPFVKIDDLLDPGFADEVAQSFPSYEKATQQGQEFKTVNEKRKIQISDSALFPDPAKRLNEALASPEFLTMLSEISGIPKLLADPFLEGGGLHVTGPGGRLDVHVDFNYIEKRKLHRRLNLLLYLNPVWNEEWGGHLQLWDREVKNCKQDVAPKHNRCLIFETSEFSYHGVTPIDREAPYDRRSFAAYYYTTEAPSGWVGHSHSTIFQARPDERLRGYLLMPAERLQRKFNRAVGWAKDKVKRTIGGVGE